MPHYERVDASGKSHAARGKGVCFLLGKRSEKGLVLVMRAGPGWQWVLYIFGSAKALAFWRGSSLGSDLYLYWKVGEKAYVLVSTHYYLSI